MNYLSQEYRIQQPQSSVDINQVDKALTVLEGKYSANKALIDQTLATYDVNLKGLRAEDNEYIANRLKEVRSVVDEFGKKNNLAYGYNKDSIMTAVKSVMEDPIVKSAIKARQNYIDLDNQVAKLTEKDQSKFHAYNYQDAKDKAGFDAYMRGEQKDLGAMTYTEYTDVAGKLHKQATEYVKLMGKKQLLQSVEGQYIDKNVFGESVSYQDIYRTLESQLDEKDKEQLRINARQTIGKLSIDKQAQIINPVLTANLNNYKSIEAETLAKLKTEKDPQKKAELQAELLKAQENISNTKYQIDNKSFDIYDVYEKDFISKIANNYDYEIITDIKYEDWKLDLAKFQSDEAYKQKDLELKEKQLKATEAQTEALTAPTIIPKDQSTEAKPTVEREVNLALESSDETLHGILMATDENYKNMSASEQWKYKINLQTSGTASKEYNNAVMAFQTARKGKIAIVDESKNFLIEQAKSTYDLITGANLNNLSKELPILVALKRQGKKFEDLDKNVQIALATEIGNNFVQNSGGDWSMGEREKGLMQSALNSWESGLANHKSDKVRRLYNLVQQGKKNTENNLQLSNLTFKASKIFGGIPIQFEIPSSGNPWAEDTDLTELEKGTDAKKDVLYEFQSSLSGLANRVELKTKGLQENLMNKYALSFSTDDKYQKTYATELKQIVVENNFPEPKGDILSVSRAGVGFEIRYVDKDGKPQTVPVKDLSQRIKSKIELEEDKWYSDIKNPNVVMPVFKFPTTTLDSMVKDMYDITKNRPDLMPVTSYSTMTESSFRGTPFETDDSFMQQVNAITKDPLKISLVQSVLGDTYSSEFSNLSGTLMVAFKNSKGEYITSQKPLRTTKIDPNALYLESLKILNEYKRDRVNEILAQ